MKLFQVDYNLMESDKRIENLQLNSEFLQEYIDHIKNKERLNDFGREETLYDVVSQLDQLVYEYNTISKKELLYFIINIHQMMIHNPYDAYEESFFFKFLNRIFDSEPFWTILIKPSNFIKLQQFYNLFNTKIDENNENEYTKDLNVDIWINLVDEIKYIFLNLKQMSKKQKGDCFKLIIDYILKARCYYADQTSFVANIESFLSEIANKTFSSYDLEKIIIDRIEEIQKMHGVYNYGTLDFIKLHQYSEEVNDINDLIEKISKQIKQNLDELNKLDIHSEAFKKNVENLKRNISSDIQSDLSNYIKEQKEEQSKEIKEEWKIINMYSTLVAQDFQNMREEFENTKALIDEKVSSGYQKLVSTMSATSGIENHKTTNPQSIQTEQTVRTSIPVRDTGACIIYFNEKYSLTDRIGLINKNKKKKYLYHKMFDDVIKAILNNDLVYIVGPSGSGKTYLANQIAEMLNLPMYNLGFIVDEFSSIKGYLDAHGHFIETPFYQAYKYGGICFFDEIDNSESKALIELNKIVGTNGYQSYLFPNGELVKPHPNFRIIAAGNTWGDGPSLLNNTREKLDEATVNRFTTYYIDYDEELEKKIMKKYPAYYQALMIMRQFYIDNNYPYLITTRDMREIAQRLDTGCFTLKEILESKIVKNKRSDTLETIIKLLENNSVDNHFVQSLDLCRKKVKSYR